MGHEVVVATETRVMTDVGQKVVVVTETRVVTKFRCGSQRGGCHRDKRDDQVQMWIMKRWLPKTFDFPGISQ